MKQCVTSIDVSSYSVSLTQTLSSMLIFSSGASPEENVLLERYTPNNQVILIFFPIG